MGKRHQASRRKAYGRRQHELRERFDRTGADDDFAIRRQAYDLDPRVTAPDPFASFDHGIPAGLRFAFRD
jgi:hypothetical protein